MDAHPAPVSAPEAAENLPATAYHRQGTLDGLCGVYCIVNALELMFGEEAFDAKKLFKVLLRALGDRLATLAVDGTRPSDLIKLIKTAQKHLAPAKLRFDFRPAFRFAPETLSEFWAAMVAHHAKAGDGSILLGMAGSHDHWTCVHGVASERLLLADSGDLDEIERRRSTIKRASKARPTIIQPMQSYFLSKVENIEAARGKRVKRTEAKDASTEARA